MSLSVSDAQQLVKSITNALAGLSSSLGQKTAANSTSVVLASDKAVGVAAKATTTGDTEIDAITAGADGTSNTSNRLAVADHLKIFNGTTWDRFRTAVSDAMAATGLGAAGLMGFNGATWDRLKATSGVLQVLASPKGYSSSKISVTRPNDTTAYTAGDVVGASAAAITFPTMGPAAGGEIMITSLTFERDVTALISGETSYRLHLYNATPPSALADNAVWDLPAGDRSVYLGYIDVGTPVDFGSSLWVEQNGINKQVTLASGSMYGYLVTNGGFTPAAQTINELAMHSVGV